MATMRRTLATALVRTVQMMKVGRMKILEIRMTNQSLTGGVVDDKTSGSGEIDNNARGLRTASGVSLITG